MRSPTTLAVGTIITPLPRLVIVPLLVVSLSRVILPLFVIRYSYREYIFPESPVIWLHVNTEPDLNLLSRDRWRLYTINDDKELVLFPSMEKDNEEIILPPEILIEDYSTDEEEPFYRNTIINGNGDKDYEYYSKDNIYIDTNIYNREFFEWKSNATFDS